MRLTFFKQTPLTADVHVSQVLYIQKIYTEKQTKMDTEKQNALNILKLYVTDGHSLQ